MSSFLEAAHEIIELENLAIKQHEVLQQMNEKMALLKKLVLWWEQNNPQVDWSKFPSYVKARTELMGPMSPPKTRVAQQTPQYPPQGFQQPFETAQVHQWHPGGR